MVTHIVSVDGVRYDDRVTVAAVIHARTATEPMFGYTDGQGRRRTARLVNFNRLSDAYRVGVFRHLKGTTLSWAVVTRRDGDFERAATLAVGRAVEKLRHRLPEEISRRENVCVHTHRVKLDADHIGHMGQVIWTDARKHLPWRLHVAYALAQAPQAFLEVGE